MNAISRAGARLSSRAPSKTARYLLWQGPSRGTPWFTPTNPSHGFGGRAARGRFCRRPCSARLRSPLRVRRDCYWPNMPQQGHGSESPSRGRACDPGGGRLLNRPPPRRPRRGRSPRILRLGSHSGSPAGLNGFRPPLTSCRSGSSGHGIEAPPYSEATCHCGDAPPGGAVRGRGLARARRESLHPPPRELRSEHSLRTVTGCHGNRIPSRDSDRARHFAACEPRSKGRGRGVRFSLCPSKKKRFGAGPAGRPAGLRGRRRRR